MTEYTNEDLMRLVFIGGKEYELVKREIMCRLQDGRATLSAPTSMSAAYSPPFTTDVPQCCGDPENCDDPCEPKGWISEQELSGLLPGPYYMDPPDGGSVTILEQLRRMAADAAKYRENTTPSAENRPAQDDVRDAQRYRALKTFAHHSYNQKVVSNAHSPSWRKEQLITVHAGSWEELDAAIDAAIASQSAKEPK